MKMSLICQKDCIVDGNLYFKKDKSYNGNLKKNYIRNGVHTFIVKNENQATCNFHSGSEYFNIPVGEHIK